ncbi:hypothetical protein L210DRAFT_3452039 [Boletus edulis BED1]|uniref:Rhodopsin domain-containing protein n=1 Tax=Boletus edulis BED1 TaxID=1328754 RepID=A0AAD4BP85_BOLED|nr:hypothetical protein L210DRAFT_3452039 [Boletus edulis BED1]
MSVDTALFVAFSAIDVLAIVATLFRLVFRLRIRRFWWEDMWAAVMVVCGTTFVIAQLVAFKTANYEAALITGWMASVAFTCTVWTSRISLLYSTIRVISPLSPLRTFTRVVTVLLLLFWAMVIVLKISQCVHDTKPTYSIGGKRRPICVLSEETVLFELITDCVSDAILLYLSLKILWRLKLPRRQRRMILSLFSSNVLMSMFSLFHAICQLVIPLKTAQYIAFDAELTSALIVCNILVVVTYIYRVTLSSPNESLPSESEEEDDFTTPRRTNTTTQLTTVDLNISLGTTTEAANSNWSRSILSPFHRGARA